MKKCVAAEEAGDTKVEVWGTGRATREFLYVDDAAEAIVLAAEHHDDPNPVNLGADREVSIREIAEQIAQLTGFQGDLVWDPTRPTDSPAAASTRPRPSDSSGGARRRPSTRASAAPSTGTSPTEKKPTACRTEPFSTEVLSERAVVSSLRQEFGYRAPSPAG